MSADESSDGVAAPQGLCSAEAAAALTRLGPNQLNPRPQAMLGQLLARFLNPLVLVLLAACVVSALTGDRASATIIGVVVAVSVLLDFAQEYRAGLAAQRLENQRQKGSGKP